METGYQICIILLTKVIHHLRVFTYLQLVLTLILMLESVGIITLSPEINTIVSDLCTILQVISATEYHPKNKSIHPTKGPQTCCYGRNFVVLPLDNNDLSHAKNLRILRIHILLFLQRARTYPCARYEKWLSDSF